ncbi:hypothetical protein F2Q68_00010268 [Brassica cretica]|uniref:Uncharacterized protein n=1 Tax=Brassica cretica TaxID=69181 RepID=A0A8S9KX99_BRACR|nr:hypothetical protein F2Q68_00010268 [Brassica cretica]
MAFSLYKVAKSQVSNSKALWLFRYPEQSLGLLRYPEQSSRLLCVKITKLHCFLPLLFQLVHFPSNATPDLTDIPSALNLSVLYRRPFGNDNRRLGGAWEAPPPWISPTYATMRLSEEWCAERWHAVVLYFPASVARNLLSRRYEPTPLEALCAEPVSLLPSKSVFLMLVRAFTLIFWQPMLWSHEVILCRFHCVWVCMSLSRTVELGGARDGLSRVVG